MPRIKINDTTIAYETWGDGPPVVLTTGGWFPRNPYIYLLAGCLSKKNRVVLWDRPNGGASDIAIVETPTEHDLWMNLMHEFLQRLNLGPAYFAGASNGCVFSLLMAHRYPTDVKGAILLNPSTDNVDILRPLIGARYLEFAEIAVAEGMEAVIEHSSKAMGRLTPQPWDGIRKWIAETIIQNPPNHERLLAMDPQFFAATMKRWGEWHLVDGIHLARLSVDDLKKITVSVLVAPGLDEIHPHHTALELSQILPDAELVDYTSHYSPEEIGAVQKSDAYTTQDAFLKLPFIEEFLQRHE